MSNLRPAIVPLALTLPDAADAVGSSETVIKRVCASEELTKRYIGTKPVLLAEDILAWLRTLPLEPSEGGVK